jgi:hypothetical protein
MELLKYKGKTYGKLTILNEPELPRDGSKVEVQCTCGVKTIKSWHAVVYGDTTSCGCTYFTAGGQSKTNPLYKTYWGMRRRCTIEADKDYKRYGAKGIKCEWNSFLDFQKDMEQSYLQHIKKYGKANTSLDRIDGTKNYCKENCRWATTSEQARNKSTNKFITYNGKTLIYADWARILGVPRQSIRYRAERGLSPKEIIETPFLRSNKF